MYLGFVRSLLDAASFFPTAKGRTSTWQSIRTMLQRSEPTEQEVRTLHGVITALSGRRLGGKPRGTPREKPESSDEDRGDN